MASTQKDLRNFFRAKKNYTALPTKSLDRKDIQISAKQSALLESPIVQKELEVTPKKQNETVKSDKRKRKRKHVEKIAEDQEGIKKYFKPNYESGRQNVAAKKKINLQEEPTNLSQVTPAEMKEKLGKCSHLEELRAKLLKFNQCEKKLQDFRKSTSVTSGSSPLKNSSPLLSPKKLVRISPHKSGSSVPPSPHKLKSMKRQLQHFQSIDIEVPVSPSKSPRKTPAKTPTKQYCYQKYGHLAGNSQSTLVLPNRYQVMKEVFRAVDTIVSLLHNRQEIITYSKLKPAVQEMIRKTFTEKQLGQIKTVFPLAYFFKQEKLKAHQHMDRDGKSSYQLTLTANLDYKKSAQVRTGLLDRFNGQPVSSPGRYRKVDSLVLVDRREVFHQSLLNIIEKEHSSFLKTLDPPVVLNGTVKHWHPDFNLEDVPEPVASDLPKPPDQNAPATAQEVVASSNSFLSVNNRMKKAVEAVAKVDSKIPEESSTPKCSALSADPKIAAALKGVSLSLLEKIRAREAAKAAREMTRSGPETAELERLSRLSEMARIIRNFFIAEKKAAIPWDTVSTKLAASYPSMLAAHEVDTHLEMLIKHVPGWCTLHKVRSGTFLKIDKNRDMQEVISTIQALIKTKSS